MLKYKIQISPTGSDLTVPVNFRNETHLSGLSQDVENLVTDQTALAINPEQDGEKRRFMPTTSTQIVLNFWNGSSYVNNVSPFDFIGASAVTTTAFISSFYVYQVFDSTIEDTQTLYHTGYVNGYQFPTGLTSTYNWNTNFEYTDVHIAKYFLEKFTANTFSMYLKIAFYSAKTGKVHPFHYINPVVIEGDIYLPVTFNLTGRTYTLANTLNFYEFTNVDYVNTVNDNISSLNITKPVYPSGNTFTVDGQYITV